MMTRCMPVRRRLAAQQPASYQIKGLLCSGVCVLLALMALQSLEAQNLTARSFGVVNTQQVILSVPEGIRARKAIEQEIEERKKVLMQKRQELEALGKEWEQKSSLLSAEAKQQKAVEFQTKVAALREDELKLQQEMREKEAAATKVILDKITQRVKALAEKKGLFAVLDTSRSGIIYMRDYVDITGDVILAFSEGAGQDGGLKKDQKNKAEKSP